MMACSPWINQPVCEFDQLSPCSAEANSVWGYTAACRTDGVDVTFFCLCHFIPFFKVQGSMHHKYIPINIQQDARLHSLFISVNCTTCFEWYLDPSSRAHTTVCTASGICQTVTATCRCCGRVVPTVVCAPDDGWRYHTELEQFTDINKL